MENGKIVSFNLTHKGAKVKYTDNVQEQGENTVKVHTIDVERRPSEQFRSILRTLLSHALLISGLADSKEIDEKIIKSRKIVDMAKFKKFNIVGFSLSGDGEDEKIKFTLNLMPQIGGAFDFNLSPHVLSDKSYDHAEYLGEDLHNVIEEIKDFIEGKNYVVQGDLFKKEEQVQEETPEQF